MRVVGAERDESLREAAASRAAAAPKAAAAEAARRAEEERAAELAQAQRKAAEERRAAAARKPVVTPAAPADPCELVRLVSYRTNQRFDSTYGPFGLGKISRVELWVTVKNPSGRRLAVTFSYRMDDRPRTVVLYPVYVDGGETVTGRVTVVDADKRYEDVRIEACKLQ
jgi:hypothetical protein